jgi:hypothetical protein
MNCPKHGKRLICPACIGRKGGASTSPAKVAASRKNAKKEKKP